MRFPPGTVALSPVPVQWPTEKGQIVKIDRVKAELITPGMYVNGVKVISNGYAVQSGRRIRVITLENRVTVRAFPGTPVSGVSCRREIPAARVEPRWLGEIDGTTRTATALNRWAAAFAN